MAVYDEKKYIFDDDRRPALPYIAGASFEIKRHEPLTPFDDGTCYEFPEVYSLSDPLLPITTLRPSEILKPRDNLTPWSWWAHEDNNPSKIPPGTITERILKHRPRKTMPHHKDSKTRRLEIVRQIRARVGAYAQVVQCRVDGIQGPLVAKIFDPLYRSDDVELDEPQSPVGLTESEWSREVAAYARILECGLDGRYTPSFKGCWSFDIPWELELVSNSAAGRVSTATTTTGSRQSGRTGAKRRRGSSEELVSRPELVTRNVRLLLMEYIPGDSILQLLETGAYRIIPPKVRMDLVAQIAESDNALCHIGVFHRDRHSRNVVVVCVNNEQGGQEWRAVWVDFGKSFVPVLPTAKSKRRGQLVAEEEPPMNPMTRCRGSWPIDGFDLEPGWWEDGTPQEGANWIDKRHDSFQARRKWMEERWGEGSPSAHLYQPVEYDRLHKPRKTEE